MRRIKNPMLVLALAGLAVVGVRAQTPTLVDQDVGQPTLKGSMTTTTDASGGKVYTIVGGGHDIWDSSDDFHYAYTAVAGDFDYIVKVQDLQGPNTWTKAELMAREPQSVGAKPQGGDRHISNMATRTDGQNGVALQWRLNANRSSDWPGWTVPQINPGYPNCWLRLQRLGDLFLGYYSTDGKAWTLESIGDTSANPMASTLFIGLAVTAHDDADAAGATGVFSNFATGPNDLPNVAGLGQVTFYDNTSGGTGTNDVMTYAAARLSGPPTRTMWVMGSETPGWDWGDNYLGQLQAYVVPPATGDYTFAIATDDSSFLFLSTDDKPANKVAIAFVNGWTNQRQYTKYPEQTSQPVRLIGGKKYYLQALWVEGGGGDGVAVTMNTVGAVADNDPAIGGAALLPYSAGGNVVITSQPKSATVNENENVTFKVVVEGAPFFRYQWYRNGTAIPGAMSAAYSLKPAVPSDDKAVFSCQVSNATSSATSANATLTVAVDTTPPTVLSAKGQPSLTEVTLTFSERLDQTTANLAANYRINSAAGALGVTAAVLSASGTAVTLTTANQMLGTKYTIQISNLKDLAAVRNTVAANTKAAFFPAGPIVEDANGFVVFEAENYSRNLDGRWIKDTTRGNPSGGASMVVPSGGSETATQLEYDIQFKKTGTHIVWYRASGNDGNSDSGWFHIDGDKDPNRTSGNQSSMTGFSGQADFAWLSQPQDGGGQFTFDIAAAGPHVVGLARRENNAYFDKFIITTDPNYRPTGSGPPETREGAPAAPTVTLTSPTEGQRFSVGATISLTASPTAATGVAIAKVEFSANGNKIGEVTEAPFTFNWSNPAEGSYTIAAAVTDEVGGGATAAAVHIKVGNPPPLVYFVTADPGPLTFAGDIAIAQHLKGRGFDVQLARGSDVPQDGSSALGASLIIESSSLGSGTVEDANHVGKFRNLAIPAMDWESSSEDAFSFQAANGSTTADQTQINIVDATSPLAAGLPKGLVTVTKSPATVSQGTPDNAHIVATLAGDPTQAVLYYYDKGETGNNGFVMPARRVFFFFQDNTASVANDDGWKLFDAATDWLVGSKPSAPPPVLGVNRVGNSVTITWTNGGTLQSTTSLTPPITWNNETGAGSFTAPATGPTKFYRVIR